jgi:hypothetical protein
MRYARPAPLPELEQEEASGMSSDTIEHEPEARDTRLARSVAVKILAPTSVRIAVVARRGAGQLRAVR